MGSTDGADQQQALHEGGMLETFLSLMPDAAVAVDRDGIIVAVNVRTESFFGYSAEELEGKPIEVLVPERFRHTHRSDRAEFSRDPHARPMGAGLDLYARRRDGTEFPVDISLAPIGDDDGTLVVAAVRDITERKAAQTAQAQLAAIVRSSTDGIFSMTSSGVMTSWNQAAEEMFGYSQADVVGHHFSQFFPDDPALEELLDAARAGRTSAPRDTHWLTREGTRVDVAISVSHLDSGQDSGFSVLVRDIRVRKAAEAQLQRQARWQTATAEIRLSLLSEASLSTSLALVCTWAVDLSGASAAALVVDEAGFRSLVATAGDAAVLARLAEQVGNLENLTESATMSLGDGLTSTTFPISFPQGEGARTGGLIVVEPDEAAPEPGMDQVLSSLASQAVLVYELASVRSQRDRLLISADRERIARDLHDLVIQRLFGAGLRLQGALALIDNETVSTRILVYRGRPRHHDQRDQGSDFRPRIRAWSRVASPRARNGGGRHRRARLQAGRFIPRCGRPRDCPTGAARSRSRPQRGPVQHCSSRSCQPSRGAHHRRRRTGDPGRRQRGRGRATRSTERYCQCSRPGRIARRPFGPDYPERRGNTL